MKKYFIFFFPFRFRFFSFFFFLFILKMFYFSNIFFKMNLKFSTWPIGAIASQIFIRWPRGARVMRAHLQVNSFVMCTICAITNYWLL